MHLNNFILKQILVAKWITLHLFPVYRFFNGVLSSHTRLHCHRQFTEARKFTSFKSWICRITNNDYVINCCILKFIHLFLQILSFTIMMWSIFKQIKFGSNLIFSTLYGFRGATFASQVFNIISWHNNTKRHKRFLSIYSFFFFLTNYFAGHI